MKKIKISKLTKLLETILIKNGLTKTDAKIVAEDYVTGELDGKFSHGILAFLGIPKQLKAGVGKKPKIVKQSAGHVFVNGNQVLGPLVANFARELVIKKAKKNGIAMVGVSNHLNFLRPGTQAAKIAEKGLIGIVGNNGGRHMVAPAGGVDPVLATNPLGIAIPTNKEPIVADFATSKRAWGEVRISKRAGRNLPAETYFDVAGNFTLNPDKANAVVPFGDFKGYVICLLAEILTGSLVNMPMGKRPERDMPGALRGSFFIAIDPAKFGSMANFLKMNTKLVNQIKRSRPQKGKEILIPGERSRLHKRTALKKGYVEIADDIWEGLEKML